MPPHSFLTFLSTVMLSSCISMQNLSKDKFSHKCNILPRLKRCNNTADMLQTQRFLRNLFTAYQKSYNVLLKEFPVIWRKSGAISVSIFNMKSERTRVLDCPKLWVGYLVHELSLIISCFHLSSYDITGSLTQAENIPPAL